MTHQNTFEKLFWPLVILLHLAAFLQAWNSGGIYLVDSKDYLSQAYNFKTNWSLYAAPFDEPIRPDFYSFRPPLYAWFILAIKGIINSDYAVLAVQSLLSLYTLFSVKKMAERFGVSALSSSIGILLILLFYPSHLIHCNFVMSDILFQFLCWQAFRASWLSIETPSIKNTSLAALFFALAMLTKPVAFLLGFSIALGLLIYYFRKFSIKLLIPFLILPGIYHGMCSWNQKVTGYYHYSSVGPFFVLKYMAKYTNAQVYGEDWADRTQDSIMQIADKQPTFEGRCKVMNEAGLHFIKQNIPVFIGFNIKGWLAFMIDPGRFDWVHFLNLNEEGFPGLYHLLNTKGWLNGILEFLKQAPILLLSILGLSLIWNLLISGVLFWFLFNRQLPIWLRLLAFLFLAYIIGSTGVLGLARYRIAVAPILWFAFLIGLNTVFFRKKHG